MALKSDPKTLDLPIILVSGAQGAIGRQHSELFEQVLDKPYRNEELLAAVERLLT
jgi:CheY-like chemotaxis protein